MSIVRHDFFQVPKIHLHNFFFLFPVNNIMFNAGEASCYLDESSFAVVTSGDGSSRSKSSRVKNRKEEHLTKLMKLNNIIQSKANSDVFSSLCKDCELHMASILRARTLDLESQMKRYRESLELLESTAESNPLQKKICENENKEILDLQLISQKHRESICAAAERKLMIERSINMENILLTRSILQYDRNTEKLSNILNMAECVHREISYLSQVKDSLIFDIPSNNNNRILSNFCVYEINGFRLSHEALPSENLNWNEINAAWACVCLSITCTMRKHNLSSSLFDLHLLAMRTRGILVLNEWSISSDEGFYKWLREKRVRRGMLQGEIVAERLYLRLEGGRDEEEGGSHRNPKNRSVDSKQRSMRNGSTNILVEYIYEYISKQQQQRRRSEHEEYAYGAEPGRGQGRKYNSGQASAPIQGTVDTLANPATCSEFYLATLCLCLLLNQILSTLNRSDALNDPRADIHILTSLKSFDDVLVLIGSAKQEVVQVNLTREIIFAVRVLLKTP